MTESSIQSTVARMESQARIGDEPTGINTSTPVAQSSDVQLASASTPFVGLPSSNTDILSSEIQPTTNVVTTTTINMEESNPNNSNQPPVQDMQVDTSTAQAGIDMISRWHAERSQAMTTGVDSYQRQGVLPFNDEEDEERRKLRILGPRPSSRQRDAYSRGMYNNDRWITPGIAEYFVPLTSRVPVQAQLGDRVSAPDRVTFDFHAHIDVSPEDIHDHARSRFIPGVEEHYRRLRVSNTLIENHCVNNFDVRWARRTSDIPFLTWLTSAQFMQLESLVIEQGCSDRVSRVILGPLHETLCEVDGVPWERYLLEVNSSSDVHEILEPSFRNLAPPPVHYSSVDGREDLVIKPSLCDSQGYFVGYTAIRVPFLNQAQHYTPLTWRRQERGKRHRFERFIVGFQCEAEFLMKRTILDRFPSLPEWWSDVEVPYGFWNEMPRIIYYWGSRFTKNRLNIIGSLLLRSEWARSVATHLLYEARAGRLWWIPVSVRQDIRTMGLDSPAMVPTDPALILPGTTREREINLAKQLAKLLEFIDMIAWTRIPKDGIIPEYPFLNDRFDCSGGLNPPNKLGRITPCFRGGDWVIFDPERWCLQLPDRYFVPFSDESRQQYVPEDPRDDRVHDGISNENQSDVPAGLRLWQSRQVSRLRSTDPEFTLPPAVAALARHPQPGAASATITRPRARGVPVSARISRDRRTQSTDSAQQLLDRLASEGITDVQSLLSRLGGSSAGAGPSSATQNDE